MSFGARPGRGAGRVRIGLRGLVALATLAAAGPAGALGATEPIRVDFSGWYWSNPLPHGSDLASVEFSGGRGYAADEHGLVLRSDDGGVTWAGARIEAATEVMRVVDRDTVLVGGGCDLRASTDAAQTFHRVPLECPDGASIVSLSFATPDVGWVLLSDGSIRVVSRARAGGLAAARSASRAGARAAAEESDATDIALLAPDVAVLVTAGGEIYRTNSAQPWTRVLEGAPPLHALHFVTADVGYAVGDDGVILRTVDGGRQWERRPAAGVASDAALRRIRCGSPELCLLTTHTAGQVFRTADGGNTVAALTAPEVQYVTALAFASPVHAVGVGWSGRTIVSNDGGATFAQTGSELGYIADLRATSATVAHGLTEGLVRTTDAGRSWTRAGDPPGGLPVQSFAFPTADLGYAFVGAIGKRGKLYRTRDGGETWTLLAPGTSRAPSAIVAPDAELVLRFGPGGARRSVDGGDTWERLEDPLVRGASRADVGGRAIVVDAPREGRFAMSTDRGRTWRELAGLPGGRGAASVDFVNRRVGYAIDDGWPASRVWVTRNGGRKWVEVVAAATYAAGAVRFGSARSGWLMVDFLKAEDTGDEESPTLLRTTDGGASWRPQPVSGEIEQLAVGGPDAAFAVGPSGDAFATQTGGDWGAATTLTLRASRRILARPGRVRIRGLLRPAEGGEVVTVRYRGRANLPRRRAERSGSPAAHSAQVRWVEIEAEVAPDGSFSVNPRARPGTTFFVARWDGDADRRSAGSRALRVRVR